MGVAKPDVNIKNNKITVSKTAVSAPCKSVKVTYAAWHSSFSLQIKANHIDQDLISKNDQKSKMCMNQTSLSPNR